MRLTADFRSWCTAMCYLSREPKRRQRDSWLHIGGKRGYVQAISFCLPSFSKTLLRGLGDILPFVISIPTAMSATVSLSFHPSASILMTISRYFPRLFNPLIRQDSEGDGRRSPCESRRCCHLTSWNGPLISRELFRLQVHWCVSKGTFYFLSCT